MDKIAVGCEKSFDKLKVRLKILGVLVNLVNFVSYEQSRSVLHKYCKLLFWVLQMVWEWTNHDNRHRFFYDFISSARISMLYFLFMLKFIFSFFIGIFVGFQLILRKHNSSIFKKRLVCLLVMWQHSKINNLLWNPQISLPRLSIFFPIQTARWMEHSRTALPRLSRRLFGGPKLDERFSRY